MNQDLRETRRRPQLKLKLGEKLFWLVGINIIPIGAGIWLWSKARQGLVSFERIPQGFGDRLLLFAVSTGCMLAFCWVLLPVSTHIFNMMSFHAKSRPSNLDRLFFQMLRVPTGLVAGIIGLLTFLAMGAVLWFGALMLAALF